jgi:hypothetical protein
VKRIATCTDQRSIVPETNALLFANCDQAFFNSLLGRAAILEEASRASLLVKQFHHDNYHRSRSLSARSVDQAEGVKSD